MYSQKYKKYIYGLKFIFVLTYMLIYVRKLDKHEKRYLAKFMSPPPHFTLIDLSAAAACTFSDSRLLDLMFPNHSQCRRKMFITEIVVELFSLKEMIFLSCVNFLFVCVKTCMYDIPLFS